MILEKLTDEKKKKIETFIKVEKLNTSKLLLILRDIIEEMIEDGFKLTEIQAIINDEFRDILKSTKPGELKYSSFYSWVHRNLKADKNLKKKGGATENRLEMKSKSEKENPFDIFKK